MHNAFTILRWNKLFTKRAVRLSNKFVETGISHGTFEFFSKHILCSIGVFYQTVCGKAIPLAVVNSCHSIRSYQTIWSSPLQNFRWHFVTWPYAVALPLVKYRTYWPLYTFLSIYTFYQIQINVNVCNMSGLPLEDTYPDNWSYGILDSNSFIKLKPHQCTYLVLFTDRDNYIEVNTNLSYRSYVPIVAYQQGTFTLPTPGLLPFRTCILLILRPVCPNLSFFRTLNLHFFKKMFVLFMTRLLRLLGRLGTNKPV